MPGQHRGDVIVQLVEVEGFLVATQTPGVGLVEQLLQPSAGRNTDPVMAARTASSSPAMVRVTKSSLRAGLDTGEDITGIQSSTTGSLTRQPCAETVSRGLNTDPNDLW